MNNPDVQRMLDGCASELSHIESIIASMGSTASFVPYLNKYSVIKACGTIEAAFKTIIADYCSKRSKPQVKTYINSKVRENSANPSFEKICQIVGEFDKQWVSDFKSELQLLSNHHQIKSSIKSLVDARNDFAHGGNPTVSFRDIYDYYNHSKHLILTLDRIIKL